MTPATVPIEARRNGDYVEEFTFTDANGLGVDLTNYTFALQVRLYDEAPGTPLLTLGEVTDPNAQGIYMLTDKPGALQITILENAFDSFPGLPTDGTEPDTPSCFDYDLRSTFGPHTDVWMAGSFTLDPGVTR